VRRREFITGISAAATWPVAVRAQQAEGMRGICVLMNTAAADVEGRNRITAFLPRLHELGWTDRRNVQVDTRASGKTGGYRKSAMELVALMPEVILANGTPR
jgi:hypothetical protein